MHISDEFSPKPFPVGFSRGKCTGRDMLWPRPRGLSAMCPHHVSAICPLVSTLCSLWPRLQTRPPCVRHVAPFAVPCVRHVSVLCLPCACPVSAMASTPCVPRLLTQISRFPLYNVFATLKNVSFGVFRVRTGATGSFFWKIFFFTPGKVQMAALPFPKPLPL